MLRRGNQNIPIECLGNSNAQRSLHFKLMVMSNYPSGLHESASVLRPSIACREANVVWQRALRGMYLLVEMKTIWLLGCSGGAVFATIHRYRPSTLIYRRMGCLKF